MRIIQLLIDELLIPLNILPRAIRPKQPHGICVDVVLEQLDVLVLLQTRKRNPLQKEDC